MKSINCYKLLKIAFAALLIFSLPAAGNAEINQADGKDVDAGTEGARPRSAASEDMKEVDKELRLVPLNTVDFKDVQDFVGPMISPSGAFLFIASRNAVLIYDSPRVIQHVEEVVAMLDKPPVNIRIAVSFDDNFEKSESGIGLANGSVVITRERGGRIEVPGDVTIIGSAGTRSGSSETTQFLLTREDHPAKIWAGESVARPVWTFEYGIRRGWWRREIEYRDIGASLWIHPRVIGDNQISVEVYPRITVEGRNPLSINARELATRVVVADGGTVQIGGLDEEQREVYRRLFGIGQVFNGRRLTISLNAEIVHPGNR